MSTQITITLPDELYQHAERFAHLANRDIASLLVDTLQQTIPPISDTALALPSVSQLSNEAVLALTQLELDPEDDARLSLLLDKQQANTLAEDEEPLLQHLMQLYQEGLLRKATALKEAVKRELIKPLDS